MNKTIRLLLVLAAVLGVVALASTGISWAARPAAEPQAPAAAQPTSAPALEPTSAAALEPASAPVLQTTSTAAPQPTSAAPTVAALVVGELDAIAGQLTDELQGTVRPPGCRGIRIVSNGPLSGGEYSVCGLVIAKVTLRQEGLEVELRPQNHTTKGAGKVIVGTIELTVRLDKKKVDGPHDPYADIELCYAVTPGQEVEVKFYDTENNTWMALETTIEDGQACAPANYSGDYVLVEKQASQ